MKGLLFFVNFFAIGYANNWIFRENSSDAYLILGGETSWIFAREMCLAQGADLLTIKDEAEKDWVFRHFPVIPRDKAATRDHFVLLGLTDIEGNDNWHWVDDTPLDDSLFEWDKHHHDIIQTCAALNTKSGKLHNLDCDYRILPEVTTRFVCKAHYRFLIDRRLSSHLHQAVFSLSRKRRHLRLCESGWHFHGTECWKLVEVKRHWFHAQVQCWNNEGRAALASLRNEDEADYVKELHEKVYGVIPAEGFWVNAFDSANEGNWTTHDGKPVYTRWAGGNPPNDPLHKLEIWKHPKRYTWRKLKKRKMNMAYYMRLFCDYQERLRKKLKVSWDHAFLLTGFDLSYHGKERFSGFGTTRSLCQPDSCAVVEIRNFKGAHTMIHELGHAMGLKHDGEENGCDGGCCMMSPVVTGGSHTWSNCSKKEFKLYLDKIKCSSYPGWCFEEDKSDKKAAMDIMNLSTQRLPGQKVPLAEQCRRYLGPCYTPYSFDNTRPLEGICSEVWCADGTSYINASHMALQGTYCGPGKWCRGGLCVPMGVAEEQIEVVAGAWGPWEAPTKDPRTQCSIGYNCSTCQIHGQLSVRRRVRICNSPTPNNGGDFCDGPSLKAEICGTEEFEGESIKSFASKVCRKIMKKRPEHPQVKNFTGVGFQRLESTEPCIIWCKMTGPNSQIYTFFDQFPDGTPCGRNNFCVSGKCLKRSCDGKEIEDPDSVRPCDDSDPEPQISTNNSEDSSQVGDKIPSSEENPSKRTSKTLLHATLAEKYGGNARNTRPTVSIPENSVRDIKFTVRKEYRWARWSSWSSCSKTCGRAFKKKTRNCIDSESGQIVSSSLCGKKAKRYRICSHVPDC